MVHLGDPDAHRLPRFLGNRCLGFAGAFFSFSSMSLLSLFHTVPNARPAYRAIALAADFAAHRVAKGIALTDERRGRGRFD